MATDCLIIGYNDSDFTEYVKMIGSMGTSSGAYRDVNLAFIEYEGKPQRSMDILNRFYFENKSGAQKQFSNVDFLWPVITYLGSYLAQRGFSFDYINLPHLEKDKLKENLLTNDILTIAITTTLYVSSHPILELIAFIREHNRTAKIVVGGPYISNQPKLNEPQAIQELFKFIGADIYVISSEGEAALTNLISALKGGSSLRAVENIAYRDGEDYVFTRTSIESNPLEDNPINYSLFPKEEINQFVTLRTAKSCPFSCSFCGFPQRAGKYKYVGVELVERELDAIRDLGNVTTLTFIDDTFNVPKARFKELLRMMIRNNYEFKWNSFYRSDHGDEETIELMGQSGCEGVFLGIESGSDAMLQRMNKSARRDDYLKSIPLLRAAGISTHANVIVGFPGETFETYQETVSLIEEAKPDFYRAQLWYADPITPIWEQREEYGVKGLSFNWSHKTMDYPTASDLVDQMFISVKGSLWLPQNGFEQWSTFYLQRKGMTLEQIKTFLRCFNAAIKDKLIHPHKKTVDADLLESLKISCQFDSQVETDMRPVEVFSGYDNAERYWLQTIGRAATASNIEMLRDEHSSDDRSFDFLSLRVEKAALEELTGVVGVPLSEIVLACFSILLSRVSGRVGTLIVDGTRAHDRQEALPLHLEPSRELSFADFLQGLHSQRQQAMPHRLYAFYILGNPVLMQARGGTSPVFDVGYLYREAAEEKDNPASCAGWKSHFEDADKLALVLEASAGEEMQLRLIYRKDWLRREVVEQLGSFLNSIMHQAAQHPDAPLKEISIERARKKATPAVEAHISEVFNF